MVWKYSVPFLIFCHVESGMFFTWSDVTQQCMVNTIIQLNSYVSYDSVVKRAPVSPGKTRLLKSRVFDTRYGADLRERIILQQL